MVGVGGRSKACDNCRRRRVKCDESKPQCQRCIRANLECGGYPGMTIIQFDGRQRHTLLSPASSHDSSPDRGGSTRRGFQAAKLSRTPSPVGFTLALDQNDVCVGYMRSRLLEGSNRAYVVPTPPAHVDQFLMKKAFLALATTFFGLEHKESTIVRQGFALYGQALENVHKALQDPSRCTSFDVLECVSIMSLFEFLISDRENGWISHCIGLERLFALRGPESFTNMSELLILENSRSPMIIGAIILRRHTVLAKPEWKTIPWSKHSVRKTYMQRLFDILADCPALFVDRTDITADKNLAAPERTERLNELLSRVYVLLDQLQSWKEKWELDHRGYYHEVPASPSKQPSDDDMQAPAWTTILEYDTPYEANTIMMSDGTYILLLLFATSIMKEAGFSATTPATSAHPQSLNITERLASAGLNICRSVEFSMRSLRQGVGNLYLLFPLRMAYDSIGRANPAVGIWIQRILERIQDGKSGRWATAKYLLGIQPASGRIAPLTPPGVQGVQTA